jgi:pimeloyl-ACP methyl ester carboxylesterase
MSRLGQDLHELLDLLDSQNVTLIGHSMGASVSLAMFSLYGTRRIAKFVAIDQSSRITNDNTWRWGVRKVEWENVWDAVNFGFSWGNPELEPPLPDIVQQALPDLNVNFGNYPHARVRQLLLDHFVADWRDVLPRIDVPTWIVTGRYSPFYDLDGMKWFANEVRNGSLSVFERSGHSPHLNEAVEFNKQLMEFLGG